MPTLYPPDGWEMVQGTWGSGIDRDESVVDNGQYSIKGNSATQCRIRSLQRIRIDRESNPAYFTAVFYRISARARGSNTTADFFLTADYFDKDQNFIYFGSSPKKFLAVNTWQWVNAEVSIFDTASSSERYFSPGFLVNADAAFTVYVESMRCVRRPTEAIAFKLIDQVIDPGAEWTTLTNWDATGSCMVGYDVSASSPELIIIDPGWYSLFAAIRTRGSVGDGMFEVRTEYHNGGAWIPTNRFTPYRVRDGENTIFHYEPSVGGFSYGEKIRLSVRHNTPGQIVVQGNGLTDSGSSVNYAYASSLHILSR